MSDRGEGRRGARADRHRMTDDEAKKLRDKLFFVLVRRCAHDGRVVITQQEIDDADKGGLLEMKYHEGPRAYWEFIPR